MSTAEAVSAIFDAPQATPAPAPDPAPASTPAAATPATPAAAAEPFLQVDDRTKYATREDALKGWKELNEYAGKLRGFEVLMKPQDQGGFGLTAEQAVAHLDAYAERLAKESQPQATPAGGKSDAATVQAATQGDKVAYDSLTPEWKQHVDYLNKLGYVTKDALKPLEDRINSLTSEQQSAYETKIEGAKQHGYTLLVAELKTSGLPHDEATATRLSNLIGDEIYSASHDGRGNLIPGSVEHRFINGTEAERSAIVKEYLGFYAQLGDSYHKSKTASYAAEKQTAQANTPRNLPPASPVPAERKGRLAPDERARRVTELLEAQTA